MHVDKFKSREFCKVTLMCDRHPNVVKEPNSKSIVPSNGQTVIQQIKKDQLVSI